ncbi:hypothetical protein NQ317_001423 [Molorchus minor]|uniref:RAP domain-containing protein n=1 Tax=Molorchus minor TaxID=1323400 RepID=A0ABQ9JXA0_9CUCU|nr:hypothetical protein NQ317_001423 [Molorchus minor]
MVLWQSVNTQLLPALWFCHKKNIISHSLSIPTYRRSSNYPKFKHNLNKPCFVASKVCSKSLHTDDENEELSDDFPTLEMDQFDQFQTARDVLFKNSKDWVVNNLNRCASVEELFNVVNDNIDIFEDAHITQTILVLRDLQNMCHYYSSDISPKKFLNNLNDDHNFHRILKLIETRIDTFDPQYLSVLFLYLKKLGIAVEEPFMQTISLKLRDHLLNAFCWICVLDFYSENSVRPYYMSLNLVPTILAQIGSCNSADDLGHLTECLNRLNNMVTTKILDKYKEKLQDFVKHEKVTGANYPVLLKILIFLNYPKWSSQNATLISKCILLMENEIPLFNVKEIITLYEVLFNNEEPGNILNSLQRCSANHLQRFETEDRESYFKLKLLSSLVYFTSPLHRIQFRKDIYKYLKHSNNIASILLLRKIFTYLKVADVYLCAKYWNLCLELLERDLSGLNVVKFCQNYMNFNTDVNSYRHYRFEHKIMKYIGETIKNGTILSPTVISTYLSFSMVYGKNSLLLEQLIEKFVTNLDQYKAVDIVRISYAISLLDNIRDNCIQQKQIDKLRSSLSTRTENLIALEEYNILQNDMLIKASVLRKDYEKEFFENLLLGYKEINYMSSKIIDNICFSFVATASLIPEIINKCTEYIIKYPDHLLGFNAERVLYLCYYLDYYPTDFFEVVTDIIIRDQERLSGLAFIQSAFSLCYFNKLPSSFIKNIFNVEFLDKLDIELDNCYSKDKYPQRVRNRLMQLNRAVCLEYPEYNVPWFHRKYMEDFYKTDVDKHFPLRIKEYLVEVLGKQNYILQDVVTPYGYHIDFVINLNSNEEAVLPNSPDIKKRLALLLVRQHSFTRFYTHLKGKYQLKRRHLEMLGYGVVIIKFNEWINLLYAEERLEFVSNKIWGRGHEESVSLKR